MESMNRDEINLAIGKLRNVYIDWHSNCKWPALLLEMPEPILMASTDSTRWIVMADGPESEKIDGATAGQAVCLAWLKWKTHERDFIAC